VKESGRERVTERVTESESHAVRESRRERVTELESHTVRESGRESHRVN